VIRALTVEPGVAGSAAVTAFDEPVGDGQVLVQGLAIGICGTDVEIAAGAYGQAPPRETCLVLGHESLGRVVDAPPGSGLVTGDLVAGIVRRPDPVPCRPCSLGEWDMCRNGRFTERGIEGLHGYGAEQWLVEPDFAVVVDPRLGELGVLIEPASVVAKAWDHIDQIAARSAAIPRTVLVTGAGPIGLLAALLGVQRGLDVHVLDRHDTGPKPRLVGDLGAAYHTSSVREAPEPDVILECTGATPVILDVLTHNRPAAIVCLTGVSAGGPAVPVDLGALNRRLVLENDVVFGSVNANRRHYEQAARALAAADHAWLQKLITRRVPIERWTEGLERRADDIKVVVDLGSTD
jgi:glucose 1-dehydrogenase